MQLNGTTVGAESTLDFTNGFAATNPAGKITIDGSGFVRTSTDQNISGNKTFSGNTTLANTNVSNGSTVAVGDASNTLTTQTAAQVNTGNGLSTGQALAVNTGSSAFSTGAGSGFFYGSGSDSLAGATTFKSTGNFTGTLVALTADQTTAGTVLGISAQNLTTGKAIDVSLGTLYSGPVGGVDSTGYTVGAVNVRAQSFSGNIFNVEARGAGAANANLANFSSTQLSGQVLNVNATALTDGKAVAVTLGNGGTGLYVNSGLAYSGDLIDLNVNGADRFKVDGQGNATIAGTLTVTGAATLASTLDVTGSLRVNTDKFTVTAANGNTTVGGTLGVTGAGLFASTLGVSGDFTVGVNKFNVAATSGNTTVAGTLGVTGAASFMSTLGVTGDFSVNTNKLIVSSATGAITGPNTGAFAIDNGNASAMSIGGATATTLNLGRAGQTQALLGNVTVAGTLTGPTSGTFAIDNGSAATLSIGGTTATTLNLGRLGQTQALLGNATVAGTLSVSGNTTVGGTLTISPLTTAGILKNNTSGVVSSLANGTDGQVLTMVSGAPAWATSASGGGAFHVTLASGLDASAAATNLANNTLNCVSDPALRTMVNFASVTKVRYAGKLGGTISTTANQESNFELQYHLGGNIAVATGDAGWTALDISTGSRTLNVWYYSPEIAIPVGAQINNLVVRACIYDGNGTADPTITGFALNVYP